MRHSLFTIVVALAWAGCSDPPPGHDVTLPSRLAATPAPAPPPVLAITLTEDGRVVADGESLTLERLSALIVERERVRAQHPSGSRTARSAYRLRIDRAAPWLHVQWLLTLLAEHKVYYGRFVFRDAKAAEVDLAWDLPYDHWWSVQEPPPLRILWLNVTIASDGKVRCGEFVSSDPDAFRRFLQDVRVRIGGEGLDGLAAEMEGAGLAPWSSCAAVWELLLSVGSELVHFRAPAAPLPRRANPLPEPTEGGREIGVGGATVRGAWRIANGLTFDEEIVEEPIPD